MNDILACLDCPVKNGCVEDKNFKGNKLDCPLRTMVVTSDSEYITIRELAAILNIPHATIYSKRDKLKRLVRHKVEISPKNHRPTLYINREDVMIVEDKIRTRKRKERKVQIVFGIQLDAKKRLKEIVKERNMPSLARLINEIVMEYLDK